MIMVGAGRRLELKQAKSYASVAPFKAYTRKVPVLFPFLPIYSLERTKASQS
jgi:hypothetical protein